MLRSVLGLVVVLVSPVAVPARGADNDKSTSFADAVKDFNQRAKQNATGKDEPALTEDEVIAAIRGWIRERVKVEDDVYRAYQKMADTKTLPPGARLDFTTRWLGFNGYDYDVWWIDLSIKTGENTGYTFRIRARMIRSQPQGQ